MAPSSYLILSNSPALIHSFNDCRGCKMSKRVYLAGPDVFRNDALQHGLRLKDYCHKLALEGMFSLDNTIEPFNADRDTAMRIFGGNIKLMQHADCAIANIEPFKGFYMDPGTAFEIGYMHALGKPVFAYTWNGKTMKQRTKPRVSDNSKFPIVEEFGLVENLMIIGGIHAVYTSAEDAILAAARYFSHSTAAPGK
jgi:nucleoside 2-deoxyribosyltransferase